MSRGPSNRRARAPQRAASKGPRVRRDPRPAAVRPPAAALAVNRPAVRARDRELPRPAARDSPGAARVQPGAYPDPTAPAERMKQGRLAVRPARQGDPDPRARVRAVFRAESRGAAAPKEALVAVRKAERVVSPGRVPVKPVRAQGVRPRVTVSPGWTRSFRSLLGISTE